MLWTAVGHLRCLPPSHQSREYEERVYRGAMLLVCFDMPSQPVWQPKHPTQPEIPAPHGSAVQWLGPEKVTRIV